VAITPIQYAGVAAGNYGPTIAYASGNTAGNLLVAVVTTNGTVNGVTDTAGNTWVKAAGNAGASNRVEIWYVKNCLNGSNTVTASFTDAGTHQIAVAEYAGADTTDPLDRTAVNVDSSGSSTNLSTGTTDYARKMNGLAVAAGCSEDTRTMTWDAPYTERYDGGQGESYAYQRCAFFADRILTFVAAHRAIGTISSGDKWSSAIAVFKAAGADVTIPNNVWIGAVQRYGRWIGAQQDNTTADHLSNYANRKEIRYGTAGVPASDLPGFPKLLEFTDTDIAAELSSNDGVCITLANGVTPVPMGLYPSADLASGYFLGRAKFDLDSGAAPDDVLGYIYFDSTQTTVENKPGAVSDGYVLFSPLEEDPSGTAPQMLDWVTNTNLGTSGGSMTSGDLVTGKVGKGIDFDGSNDEINFASAVAAAIHGKPSASFLANIKNASSPEIDSQPMNFGSGAAQNDHWPYSGGSVYTSSLRTTRVGPITPGVTLTDWHQCAITTDATTWRIYFNGAEAANTSAQSTVQAGAFGLGYGTGSNHWAGVIDEVQIISVARSADWLAYAYTDDFDNVDTFTIASEGGSGTTVTPGVASLVITTYAPTARTPRLVTPPVRTLSLTTFAPKAILGTVIVPPVKTLTLTTFAPTVSTPRLITPGVKALTLTTFAPTVNTPRLVTPPVKALILTPFAPVINLNKIATPPTKSLTLSTFAPVVSAPRLVTPGVKTLSLTTFAPTVTTTAAGTYTPGTASLVLTKYAPTVLTPRLCTPGKLSLVTTLYPPGVTGGQGVTVIPGKKALTLTTFAPVVSSPRLVTPGLASLLLTRFQPTVSTPRLCTPGRLSLLTGLYAPTVTVEGSAHATPGTLALVLTAYAPTVTAISFAGLPVTDYLDFVSVYTDRLGFYSVATDRLDFNP